MIDELKIQTLNNPPKAITGLLKAGLTAYNLTCIPQLTNLSDDKFIVVARDDRGEIIGGVSAEFDFGWMFVDILWVADGQRGQGLGARLLHTAEQVALEHDIDRCYLMTSEFQAPRFYPRHGYREITRTRERPPGYDMIHFIKRPIADAPYDTSFDVQFPPVPDDLKALDNGLRRHASPIAPIDIRTVATVATDSTGDIFGGIMGILFWGWCEIRTLWIADEMRRQGLGKQLLSAFEATAHERGAHHMLADVTDWQAPGFFAALGYQHIGQIDDRPPQHITYLMQKALGTQYPSTRT